VPELGRWYLRPAIGFAMWHLLRGKTPAEVLRLFRERPRFSGLTDQELAWVLTYAQGNVRATDRLGFVRPDAPAGLLFAPELPPEVILVPPREPAVPVPPPVAGPAPPRPPERPPAPPAAPPAPAPPAPTLIGWRVLFHCDDPDFGRIDISVTVNTGPGVSPAEVLALAKLEAERIARDQRNPSHCLGTLSEGRIIQAIAGGLESPRLVIPEPPARI